MKFSEETEKLMPKIQHPCPECKFSNLRECIEDCKESPILPACPHCGQDFTRIGMLLYIPLRRFNSDTIVMSMFARMTLASLRVHRFDDTVYYNLDGKPIPRLAAYCSSCFNVFVPGASPQVDKYYFSRFDETKLRKNSAILSRLASIRLTAKSVHGMEV